MRWAAHRTGPDPTSEKGCLDVTSSDHDNGTPPVDRTAADQSSTPDDGGDRRDPVWVNWLLALLTVPVAMVVVVFAFGQVMGLARCTTDVCRHLGPGEFWFGVLFYGPPVVALLTMVVSFFTAPRRWGIWVPVCGLALLVADLAALAVTFRQ